MNASEIKPLTVDEALDILDNYGQGMIGPYDRRPNVWTARRRIAALISTQQRQHAESEAGAANWKRQVKRHLCKVDQYEPCHVKEECDLAWLCKLYYAPPAGASLLAEVERLRKVAEAAKAAKSYIRSGCSECTGFCAKCGVERDSIALDVALAKLAEVEGLRKQVQDMRNCGNCGNKTHSCDLSLCGDWQMRKEEADHDL